MNFGLKMGQIGSYLEDLWRHGSTVARMNDLQRVHMANLGLEQLAQAKNLVRDQRINPIGGIGRAIMSPVEAIGGIAQGNGIKESLKQVYTSGALDEKTGEIVTSANWGNIVGSGVTASVGMGVLGGLTHDTSGNADIAGLPGI